MMSPGIRRRGPWQGEVAVGFQGHAPQDHRGNAALGGGAEGRGVVPAVGRAEEAGADAEAGGEFALLAADLRALGGKGPAGQGRVMRLWFWRVAPTARRRAKWP
ncbi:hypothetical protein SALBM217S_03173 [Streptomyces griseoloalbus]